ncbi:MAG: EI24 domain-containing protein [Desulfobacterales bacterium]|nr:EI24 domain-containing protein [Desulfobacterales bacterium]
MSFIRGIKLNFEGFLLGLRTPRLLMLGLLRFAVMLLVFAAAVAFFLAFHSDIIDLIWSKPASIWLVWIWYLVSWLLSLILLGATTVVGYFIAQILFSVVIMDLMSRITEKRVTGREVPPPSMPYFQHLIFLVRQEIPRTVVPVLLALALMALGWLTPLSPVVTILSPAVAALFLAWDYTDLVPARQLLPFKDRFAIFKRHLLFHLGFGVLFLVPLLNLALLSFAPVGATLFHLGLAHGDDTRGTPAS